jgi:hypothetical protein
MIERDIMKLRNPEGSKAADTDTTPDGWPDAARPVYPKNPEQSGMHLLRSRLTGHLTGWYWNATTGRFHHEHITLGRTALLERYVYEGPILLPSEVAAQVDAARREGVQSVLDDIAQNAPALGAAIRAALKETGHE